MLPVLPLLGLVLAQAANAPLASAEALRALRGAAGEIARAGEGGLAQTLGTVLARLGDDPRTLARLATDCERRAAAARPSRSARAAAAGALRRALTGLVKDLSEGDEARRRTLALAVLELDRDSPEANAALGRTRTDGGDWLDAEARGWRAGASEVAALERAVDRLELELVSGPSDNPTLQGVEGGGSCVRWGAVALHARLPAEDLERILSECLRAAAFSHGLLTGSLALPETLAGTLVLLAGDSDLRAASAEALAAGGLAESERDQTLALGLTSFVDQRGWRTARGRTRADAAALLLWDLLPQWIGADAAPCLRSGHLNMVCLARLGTSMPTPAWSEVSRGEPGEDRTRAVRADPRTPEVLLRAARRTLVGCRAWMVGEVRAQRDPPWARAMLDQEGKIMDAALLKTTLVCTLLQEEGRLSGVLDATRGPRATSVAAYEEALGERLPRLEARWRRWLDPDQPAGVLQRLEAMADASAEGAPSFDAALLALNQARANALLGQFPEIPVVTQDEELARGAADHARYLVRNPERAQRWPDMHEELRELPGFSPAGARAAGRSSIASASDASRAVGQWLGTFFHRLPLLDPGLIAVGFGQAEEVVVLDCGSLVLTPRREHVVVWPLPEAEGVPLRLQPEVPTPVPGVAQETLGFPLSVQLYRAEPGPRPELTLELFEGALEDGAPVEGYRIAPGAPLQPALAPENAWGLIPKVPLRPRTRYTARARFGSETRVWSFTTGA